LPFTGRFYDGLGNKVTMHAYANPTTENYTAAGYGLVRFDKSTRRITIECWPRHVDVTDAGARQVPGWPISIGQEDNYSRAAMAYLPRLEISGQEDPVVQVIDEYLGEIVYTLRINGTTFKPKVFREGVYTIRVGEGPSLKTFPGVESAGEEDDRVLRVKL
jgi:hypothetical protein